MKAGGSVIGALDRSNIRRLIVDFDLPSGKAVPVWQSLSRRVRHT